MIVDQNGKLVHYKWASGGQGAKQIRAFLNDARCRLANDYKPIVYCDHLVTHKTLANEKSFVWDVRLIPVSSSDANIIEHIFSSLKAYLYKNRRGQENVKNVHELINWCGSMTDPWWQRYNEDDKLLNNSRKFLRQLIKPKGNLQTVSLLNNNFNSLQDLKIKPLPQNFGLM